MTTLLGNIGQTAQASFITKDILTGETPMYNPINERYYYVDIEYGDVHQYDPQSGIDQKWHLNN